MHIPHIPPAFPTSPSSPKSLTTNKMPPHPLISPVSPTNPYLTYPESYLNKPLPIPPSPGPPPTGPLPQRPLRAGGDHHPQRIRTPPPVMSPIDIRTPPPIMAPLSANEGYRSINWICIPPPIEAIAIKKKSAYEEGWSLTDPGAAKFKGW